ncbi:MAG: RHS repeat-associated core domain-containing protein, partial [Gammaproteobacteria bacterium]
MLTYDSTDSLLLRVDVSTGEYLDFRYDADNRMERITDHADRSWGYRYTTGNLLEFVENPDGSTRQYHYENPDYPEALTGITDENGIRYASYGYDADGQANFSTLAGNVERVDVTYEPDGQRTVTNSRGYTSSYTVVSRLGMALPAQASGPGCAGCGLLNTSYQYDAANNVTRVTREGVITEYGDYDSKGNPGYMIEATGTSEERRTDYAYDPRFDNRVTRILSPSVIAPDPAARCTEDVDCRKTEYTYDSQGNRLTETSSGFAPDGTPVSRTTTYQYNGPLHQLSRIDGPRTDVNDITTLEYYADDQSEGANRARLRRVRAADGMLLRDDIVYTATGKIALEYRSNNILIEHAYYPGNDRLKSSTVHDLDSGNSSRTEWTYLPTGEVKSITTASLTPDATILIFGYDNARRVTNITDGLGNYVEYTLDTEGNRTGESIHDSTGMLGKALTRTYDAYNRLDISMSGADSYNPLEQADSDYSTIGNLDRQTDGNGVVTGYSYDNLNRLLSSTRDLGGLGATTRYGYDAADRLASVMDPADVETRYEYDDLGNLLSAISQDSGTIVYSYDAAGNVKTRQDAMGQLFSYSYDVLGRLTGVDTPGAADDITYNYDNCANGSGRLCSITRGSTTVSYSYDAFGKVVGHQQLSYTYDAASRVKTIAYPSGAVVTYSYDVAGQVSQVDLMADGTTTTLASGISYAPFGSSTDLVFGNGATLTQGLDTAYRLTSQSVPAVLDLDYALYDGNGNLRIRTDAFSGSSDFSYDTLSRLDTGSGPFGTRDYAYDLNGNRIQLISDGLITNYGYTPRTNRLERENSWIYTLDDNGNTTHKLTDDGLGFVYTYNSHNRLIAATARRITDYTGKGRNRTPVIDDVALATYAYNGLDQRVSKTLADGTLVQYLYGTDGALLAELDGTAVVQREYVYLNGQLLAVLDQTTRQLGGDETIVDNGTAPVGWTSNTSNKDYGADYLYSDGGSGSTVRWIPALDAGTYDVYVWYVRSPKYSDSVPFTINHNGLTDTMNMDQTTGGGSWQLLAGNITFNGSGSESVEVSDINGRTTADAVKFVNVSGGSKTTTTVSYVHNDHLGTPQAMTDETGDVVWRAMYDPFGKATVTVNNVALNVRLPGQYFDAETGLHYNYYRYYEPSIGRYLTSDPIGLGGGSNIYAYVGGKPLKYFDLFGLDAQMCYRPFYPIPQPYARHCFL